MEEQNFWYFLFASSLIHIATIPAISAIMPISALKLGQNPIPIELIHFPAQEKKNEAAVLSKRSSTKGSKLPTSAPQKASFPERFVPQGAPAKMEELEVKKNPHEAIPTSHFTGLGSVLELGSGTLEGRVGGGDTPLNGDLAAGAGNAIASSGTGGDRGPPAPGTGETLFRAAKPLQTARAAYPPIALRMGLEADVTLKIFVDSEGKITNVEVVKSAGMGFDEEAVKTVRQFRFEPAKRDGVTVPSEFTYIYKFRLK